MIQRVSKHSGYIEVLTTEGDKHNQVGGELRLFGWGPNSYAVSHGSDYHVHIYDERGSMITTLSINKEYTNLHWDGNFLTFENGGRFCTMDINNRLIESR